MRITNARRLIGGLTSAGALALLAAVAPAQASTAVTFHVQTTADGNQAAPGTTKCATSADTQAQGKCTLRSAIEAADNEPSGTAVTVEVPPGTYTFSTANEVCIAKCFSATSYALEILAGPSSISVVGAGAAQTVIDANHLDRVFDVASNATASISGVTVENGTPPTPVPPPVPPRSAAAPALTCPTNSPPEQDGGGILDSGILTLKDDVVTNNLTTGNGGGIDNNGPGALVVVGTTVSNNVSCSSGSGLSAGGGIDTWGGASLTIRDSKILGNDAAQNGNGGGVAESESSGNTRIIDTTIAANRAFSGGGVEAGAGGTFLLFGDTLSGNHADNNGGGLDNGGGDTDTYVNTTITRNTAGSNGGGIEAGATFNNNTFGNGEFISFSTLTDNTASQGTGDIGVSEVGGASVDDSIIATGHPQNCPGFGITDNGHNVFDDVSDHGAQCGASPTTHDRIGDPKLGPLQDNGGPTKTEALLAGSPAIDHADTANCTSETKNSSGDPVDQREFVPRPQGAACDIGAFEATPNLGITASPNKASIFVGQQDTVTDVITNSGPTDAANSTFTDPGANYRIDSVTSSQGKCTHTATTISCQLNTIHSGHKVTITIVLTGISHGAVTLRSRTATSGLDLSQANNKANVHITVKSKPKPPPPPPPGKPAIRIARLGPACHPPKSTVNITAMASAAAGIKSAVISVTGHGYSNGSGYSPPAGKTVRKATLHDHVSASKLHPGATYRVTAKVVDTMGRSAEAHTSFMVCKPPPKQGFTG